jgi:hypothetical protein
MTQTEFEETLIKTKNTEDRIIFIRKFFVHGIPFVFGTDEGRYFDFRSRIANKFKIDFQEVFIVGSAKLGFSYLKKTPFSLESDIDVVIVNPNLFNFYHMAIAEYQYQLDIYRKTITIGESEQYQSFLKYFIKGWIRPDLIPTSFDIEVLRTQWFDYFKSISSGKSEVGNYKVSAGIFKDLSFFETYHLKSINKLYEKISLENGQANSK